MKIDRSRFLLLTASLAAAACDRGQHAASPDTGGAEPAQTPTQTRDEAARPSEAGSGDPSVWLEIEPGTEDRAPPRDDSCSNATGQPADCDLSPPGSHCESFDSTVNLCRSFHDILQPRAAEAAVDCLLAASGTARICDWQIWNQCTSAGLQASCVDPGMRGECDSISSTCGGSVDVFTCQQALSAVRPHRLERLASCLREFCEVPFCVSQF